MCVAALYQIKQKEQKRQQNSKYLPLRYLGFLLYHLLSLLYLVSICTVMCFLVSNHFENGFGLICRG